MYGTYYMYGTTVVCCICIGNIGVDELCHGYTPKWFVQEEDAKTGNVIHRYTGEYWQCKEKQDWCRCPDIYL